MSNTMTWSRFAACMAAAALGLSLWGCSRGPSLSGTVAVSGIVTHNGSPLDGANVGFIPIDPENGKPANGLTDAEGRFQLRTYLAGSTQANGILPGEYKVSFSKTKNLIGYDPATGQSTPPADPPAAAGSDAAGAGEEPRSGWMASPEELLPAKYANPDTSGFTVTIKPSGNEPLKFDLTD